MRIRHLLYHTLLASSGLLAQSDPNYYWRLDEIGGAIAHDDMGTSDGQLQGSTTWQPSGGHHAGALRCYGNDARVDLGPCDITTGAGDALSLACWFRPEIVSGTERILVAKTIGSNNADFVWSLSLVNNTGARFRVRTNGVVHTLDIPPSSIFSNTWYHLAATYDGTDILFYLNGSITAFSTASGSIGFHPQVSATLGNLVNNDLPFYGSLDDVRIYDRALSALEVIDLVIGDVATGVEEPHIAITANGTCTLPAGPWNDLRLLDMSGRLVAGTPVVPGTTTVALPEVPPGIYVAALRGPETVLACTLSIP